MTNATVSGVVVVVTAGGTGTLTIVHGVTFNETDGTTGGGGRIVVDDNAHVVLPPGVSITVVTAEPVRNGQIIPLFVVQGNGSLDVADLSAIAVNVDAPPLERACEDVASELQRTPDQRGIQLVLTVDDSACGGGGDDGGKIIAAIVVPVLVSCVIVTLIVTIVRVFFVGARSFFECYNLRDDCFVVLYRWFFLPLLGAFD